MTEPVMSYSPDRSLAGKLRRRLARLSQRRLATGHLDRPTVSFSFDDAPLSACNLGARILEERGLRGTYYISAGFLDRPGPMGQYASAGDIRRLHQHGHEIGCHTYTHLDCGKASEADAHDDCDLNNEIFASMGIPPARSFAYPYGDVSTQAKKALASRFNLLRALHHGLIESGADLNQAPSVGIEGALGEEQASRWIEKVAERRAWLILYTHDIEAKPSEWGCSPAVLERLIDLSLTLGCDVMTVSDAAARMASPARIPAMAPFQTSTGLIAA